MGGGMAVRADAVEYGGIVAVGGRIVVTARALAAGVVQAELRHFGADTTLTPIVGERPGGDYSLKAWSFDITPLGPGAKLDLALPLETPSLDPSYVSPTLFELRLRVIGLNTTDPGERDVSVTLDLDGTRQTGRAVDGGTGGVVQAEAVIAANHALTILLG